MTLRFLSEKMKPFPHSQGKSAIDRHCAIVYALHTAIVVIIISVQLAGLGGSQEVFPKVMSVIHLSVCLTLFMFWRLHRLSIPKALSIVALVAQTIFVFRAIYFAQERPENFLQFFLLNQIASLLAVVFLVMCFVKYTPFIVAALSLSTYAGIAAYLEEPALWNIFGFFVGAQIFLCVLGELLRRNVLHVNMENISLHMHAVRLNEREIEGYLRMSSNDHPSADDVDPLFAMLTPKSQRNIINAVRMHLRSHLMDDCDLTHFFPALTKSAVDVCSLILQGKKLSEICQLLDKTEKNIGVVRTHVRRKLNVPSNQDLKNYLMEKLADRRQKGVD